MENTGKNFMRNTLKMWQKIKMEIHGTDHFSKHTAMYINSSMGEASSATGPLSQVPFTLFEEC